MSGLAGMTTEEFLKQRDALFGYISKGVAQATAIQRERSLGPIQTLAGESAIGAAADYTMAAGESVARSVLDVPGQVVRGVTRLGTAGFVDTGDLTLTGLLSRVRGQRGDELARNSLRYVEGDRGALKASREIVGEALGFIAPFGIAGKTVTAAGSLGALGRVARFGVELPGSVVAGISSRVAGRLTASAEARVQSWAAKHLGAETAAISARAGTLLRDTIKAAPWREKVRVWFGGNLPQIAGTALGMGPFAAVQSAGMSAPDGLALRSFGESVLDGAIAAAMSPAMVFGSQLGNLTEQWLTKRGLQRDSGEALVRYLETGKGWSPSVAKVAGGLVEGAFDVRGTVDAWRAISTGDDDAIYRAVVSILGSSVGAAAMRRFGPDQLPVWRREFPEDKVNPLSRLPASLDDHVALSDVQRHGWVVDAAPRVGPEIGPQIEADAWLVRRHDPDMQLKLSGDRGGLTVELQGKKWARHAAEIGAEISAAPDDTSGGVMLEPGKARKDKMASLAKVERVFTPKVVGDDAERVLDSIATITATDNMWLRGSRSTRDMTEVEPGLWYSPDRDIWLTRQFGQNGIRYGEEPWQWGVSLEPPRVRSDLAEPIVDARNWLGQLKRIPDSAKDRIARALSGIEHSAPFGDVDDGAAAAAFLSATLKNPRLRVDAENNIEAFSRILHRIADGTMSMSDAVRMFVWSTGKKEPFKPYDRYAEGVGLDRFGISKAALAAVNAKAKRWQGESESLQRVRLAEEPKAEPKQVDLLIDENAMARSEKEAQRPPDDEAQRLAANEQARDVRRLADARKERERQAAEAAAMAEQKKARAEKIAQGKAAAARKRIEAGDTAEVARSIGGISNELIQSIAGVKAKEWFGSRAPNGVVRRDGIRTMDRLAEALVDAGVIQNKSQGVEDRGGNVDAAMRWLEALRQGQTYSELSVPNEAVIAEMQAREADFLAAAEQERAEMLAEAEAEREAMRAEVMAKLESDPDFDIGELDRVSPLDPRIDEATDQMTSEAPKPKAPTDGLDPQAGATSIFGDIAVAVQRAVQGSWRAIKSAGRVYQDYWKREVAEKAIRELEGQWNRAQINYKNYLADIVELSQSVQALLGRDPLTGDRATTSAGRRAGRILNRSATAQALADLTFYLEQTGNPAFDSPDRVDQLADVEARLRQEFGSDVFAEFAARARTLWDSLHERAKNTPLINAPEYLQNYIAHHWKSGPDGKPITDINSLLFVRESRIANPRFSRQRTIATLAEGIRAGWTPQTLNPFELLMRSAKLTTDIEVAASFLEDLRTSPIGEGAAEMMVMPTQDAPDYYQVYDHPLLDGYAVHPELIGGTARDYSKQSRLDRILGSYGGFDVLQRALGASDFRWGDHPFLSAAKNVALFLKAIKLKFSLFHPFVLSVENRFLYMTPTVDAIAKAARGDFSAAKQAIGAWRGPNTLVEALRNDMTRTIEMLRGQAADAAISHGLQLTGVPSDFKPQAVHVLTEGIRRIAKKFGGEQIASVVESLDVLQDRALWDILLPKLKLDSYYIHVERERARQGRELTDLEMRRVADFVNGTMGNTDWRRVWRVPKQVSDLMAGLTFFAWDWTASNLRAGPVNVALGVANIPTEGLGNQLLRYGLFSTFTSAIKAAVATTVVQQAIWAIFGSDEERDRLRLAGKSELSTLQNEGQNIVDAMLSIRLPMRGAQGEQVYLKPWKQISEVFNWFTEPQTTFFNKLSVPLQEAIKQVAGIKAPGWPEAAQEDAIEIDGLGGLAAEAAKTVLDWFTPFSVANTTTPLGKWGIFSPFPVAAGTTNYKTRTHLALVWENYARTGDVKALNDAKWIAHGAEANSLPVDTLYKQSISIARGALYQRYFAAINDGDIESAGHLYLGLARLGATSKDVRASIRSRFRAAIGRREQPEIDLREAFDREAKTYQSILQSVPDAKQAHLQVRRDILESYRENARFVIDPAKSRPRP